MHYNRLSSTAKETLTRSEHGGTLAMQRRDARLS